MKIKELHESDYDLLKEFIYWAIFVPPGTKQPERNIINNPDVFIYIDDFGQKDDYGVFAEVDGNAVGAAWTRIIPAYGYIDDETPELAMSMLPEYRSQGVGTELMKKLFELLSKKGYKETSLAVQKENPAVNFYLRLGYEIASENDEEFVMIKKFNS